MNWVDMLVLLLYLALSAAIVFLSPILVVDDSFISFRYAYNLAHGLGLVYNSGQHVEGYTNLLWTLMAALPLRLGIPILPLASIAGICFAWLAGATLWLQCRALCLDRLATALALVSLSLYQGFWQVAGNGLEGGLFSFLLMQTVYWLFKGRPVAAGLCGALLFTVRPDSLTVIPLCCVFAFAVRSTPRWRERSFAGIPALAAPWAAMIVVVTLWRLGYYHAIVPNTITAKSAPIEPIPIGVNVIWGIVYCLGFAVSSFPLVFGIVLARLGVASRWRAEFGLATALVAVQVPVVLLNGGDWMPNFRLLAVYSALLALTLAISLTSLRRRIRGRRVLAERVIASLLVLSWTHLALQGSWREPGLTVMPGESCWINLAQRLRPYLHRSDTVAPEALGFFGYDLPTAHMYDFQGLTDTYTAHHGTIYFSQFGRFDPSYAYFRVRPSLFIFQSGTNNLRPMVAVSRGQYGRTYTTYSVSSDAACAGKNVVVSFLHGQAPRLLPAFGGLVLRRLTLSS